VESLVELFCHVDDFCQAFRFSELVNLNLLEEIPQNRLAKENRNYIYGLRMTKLGKETKTYLYALNRVFVQRINNPKSTSIPVTPTP
jgi:hypothetical protein